ncbi:MAG TPA: DUF1833 family protein [Reyranella sp.]|jgi:hypothetical protein|nr:DUF1833 family protein [Reyranella sp.]
MREAIAMAPSDEVVLHTIELRHPLFVDDDGNPDSIWVVLNETDIVATVEAGAPVKGGTAVTFRAFSFQFSPPGVDTTPSIEFEVTIDNVDSSIVENLDLAVTDSNKIVMCYRPYLDSDLSEPQMLPPPTFVLSEVKVDVFQVRARARIDIDLRGAFPRRLFTAAEFPGLINQ